ncbi:MAG: polyphosphate polymerase domain-containing protein [Gammaproteobacteria bacterium]|nr:polyphosphate polymerase domain-containing protein [Gammaproteobacteria bacterium]MCP4090514.1 polyphosphate polymerase domain-containing protein [Gammaproteobacteria bacterium]MCP4276621.1 polyphosphate polymerase domain-containing protein [Gammaproteobacteria bacterium]MCP4831371.1 polyphosphate polymerase domain-containing protein [Gammaproteobacteria bacterium]MCP4927915.1 polyphosphate polymerase domain-containing protein [Gammaproteobacteria bacterium]
MQVPETARQEIKFVANRLNYDLVEQWLRLHSLGFYEAYPERVVNNVYFDTFELSAYAENLAGVSQRTKVRYRWYGSSQEPAAGRLEIKQKRNQYGWKQIYKVPEAPWKPGSDWVDVRQSIALQGGRDASVWLEQNPEAVMINRYLRRYYLSACGRIRITLDFNQKVWDQRNHHYPSFTREANLPETFVVECKCDRSERELASRVLLGMPIRVSRHSKYMNAVSAIL